MILVSACLAGEECRYNGTAFLCEKIAKLVEAGQAVAVCPEVLGGLPIPRTPAEILGERILTVDGQDVTDEYRAGAEAAIRIALAAGCRMAILKARSPSCGSGRIYDGSFSGRTVDGDGVFAQCLKQAGITIYSDEEYLKDYEMAEEEEK